MSVCGKGMRGGPWCVPAAVTGWVPGVLWESWVSTCREREGWGTEVWAQPPGIGGFGVGGLTFALPWGSVTRVVGDLGEIWVCVQSPGAWGPCLGLGEGTWPPPRRGESSIFTYLVALGSNKNMDCLRETV